MALSAARIARTYAFCPANSFLAHQQVLLGRGGVGQAVKRGEFRGRPRWCGGFRAAAHVNSGECPPGLPQRERLQVFPRFLPGARRYNPGAPLSWTARSSRWTPPVAPGSISSCRASRPALCLAFHRLPSALQRRFFRVRPMPIPMLCWFRKIESRLGSVVTAVK